MCVCVYTYKSIGIYIYICMYVCMYVYAYVYVCTSMNTSSVFAGSIAKINLLMKLTFNKK